MTGKKYLFVSGPPRSGTTALTRLLNSHPEIVLGIERYKFLLMRNENRAEVSPRLFEPDRFLAMSPTDSNVGLERLGDLAPLRAKLQSATYVGDKVPRLITRIRELDRWFPDHRMIFIFRDPYRVASSWTVRAGKSSDAWDATRDYRAAVATMNAFFEIARKLRRKRPDRFCVVSYERIFDPADDAAVRALVDWLGLAYHPDMQAKWQSNAEKFRTIQAKPLAEIDRAFVESGIDWKSFGQLRELTA